MSNAEGNESGLPAGEYPPPTGPVVAGPTKPRRSRLLWWLLGGFSVLLLVGCGGCGFVLYQFYGSSTGVGTRFATAVQLEDYSQAYGLLCEQSQNEITLDQFETIYVPQMPVERIEAVAPSFRASGSTDTFVVSYVLENDRETVEYPMVRENGDWRVCEPPSLV